MAFNIPKSEKPRVVIVGGGFGGLKLANHLKGSSKVPVSKSYSSTATTTISSPRSSTK